MVFRTISLLRILPWFLIVSHFVPPFIEAFDIDGIYEYHAVVDGKVALPCNASLWSEDSISLVIWFHGNSSNPVFSLDARNVPLSKAKHFEGEDYEGRVQFDTSIIPPVLRLDPVLEEDGGEYRCRVDYRKAPTQNFIIYLNITVPPRETIIMDEYGQRLYGIIGPLDEGSSLTLICEADGGRPPPSVTWWKGSTLIDESYMETPSGVRNTLDITALDRTDLFSIYTCQASNNNYTLPIPRSVTIDLNLKPSNVRIFMKEKHFLSGQEAKVECQASGSRPAAHITWWKVGRKLENVKEDINGNVTTSVVTFIPRPEDNGRLLSCRAENPELPNSPVEDAKKLDVHYKPQMSVALGASIHHDTIREGSDVYFECNILSNPWVTDIGWYFEGSRLVNDPASGIIISNQSLVLQKVKLFHRGHYKCVANNTVGQGESEEVLLKVNYAPMCQPGQRTVYGVARHEIANVSCDVDADPSDVRFFWSFNNTLESVEIDSYYANGTRSVVSYIPQSRMGYGSLYCWAKNRIGSQKDPCTFHIIPAVPPEPVKHCVVTNQSVESILVECQPGSNGGLRQSFNLEVYNSVLERLHANMTSEDAPFFFIRDLPPATSFLLVVYATNAKGRSNSITLTASTLPFPERHTANGSSDDSPFTPLIGALIGVVGVLVLVAVVIVVAVKIRADEDEKATEDQEMKPQTPMKTHSDGILSVDLPDFEFLELPNDCTAITRASIHPARLRGCCDMERECDRCDQNNQKTYAAVSSHREQSPSSLRDIEICFTNAFQGPVPWKPYNRSVRKSPDDYRSKEEIDHSPLWESNDEQTIGKTAMLRNVYSSNRVRNGDIADPSFSNYGVTNRSPTL